MQRAEVDLAWRADTTQLHATIERIVRQDPKAAASVADAWLDLALCERDADAASRAVAAMATEGYQPYHRSWSAGIVAQMQGDPVNARAAFNAARVELDKILHDQPDYPEALNALAVVDASLGNKDAAIREGQRAIELVPVSKDSILGASFFRDLAVIYAFVGEKDLALQQLEVVAKTPGDLSYGGLRLHPFWDSLRGDPRFESIVASLAPAAAP